MFLELELCPIVRRKRREREMQISVEILEEAKRSQKTPIDIFWFHCNFLGMKQGLEGQN
jgi:predicted transcriptional regulator